MHIYNSVIDNSAMLGVYLVYCKLPTHIFKGVWGKHPWLIFNDKLMTMQPYFPWYTLRSKGAKWHLLGFFWAVPNTIQKVQRTLLGGSLKRTLLRTLTWGSLKEPWRVLLNHKLGAANNHLGFFIEPCAFMKDSLKNPLGFILWPWFLHWGWFKTFYDELQNYIPNIFHRRKILLSSLMMLI